MQTKEGFYFGCPNVPDENRYEYFTVFCTLILCVIFFVMIPIFALLISGDRACDTSRLKGVTSPYKDELVPKMPVMVEYYTDWYQYSKLFDVYDGAATSATSADKAGYYYYVNILGFLRFGYADQDERVWFEGKYNGFGARLKPYADMEATRCEGEETKYRVTEDYWDRTWFCWSRCERHFHVYRRKDEKSEFKPYADAVFYDEPRYDYGSDYGFDSQTASLNARSMNLTDAKSGNLISRAQLTLGDPYAEVRLGVYPPPARPRPKANPPTHITHLPTLHSVPPSPALLTRTAPASDWARRPQPLDARLFRLGGGAQGVAAALARHLRRGDGRCAQPQRSVVARVLRLPEHTRHDVASEPGARFLEDGAVEEVGLSIVQCVRRGGGIPSHFAIYENDDTRGRSVVVYPPPCLFCSCLYGVSSLS